MMQVDALRSHSNTLYLTFAISDLPWLNRLIQGPHSLVYKLFCVFSSENTWEPEANLDCQDLIKEYELKVKREEDSKKAKSKTKDDEPKKKKAKPSTAVGTNTLSNISKSVFSS